MSLFYNRRGARIDMATWLELFADLEYRRIERTEIDGEALHVSTCWLGLDHGLGVSVEPLIFETMIFHSGDGRECWRWATEADAIAGHARAVSAARAAHARRTLRLA